MEKEISIDGHKIVYRVIGNGKTVVFIHGFGEDGRIWRSRAPFLTFPQMGEGKANTQSLLEEDSLLTGKFKFIIPDLPGSGKSEMIEDMSIEGMAEVIKKILDEEGPSQTPVRTGTGGLPEGEGFASAQSQLAEDAVTKENFINSDSSKVPPPAGGVDLEGAGVILVGHSMGGYIALAFAEKYSEYLNGLGLFHSSTYADTEEKKATRRKGIEFINSHGGFEFLKTTVPNLFSPYSKDQMPELIDGFISSLSNFKGDPLVSYYEAMIQRPDRTAVLKKLKIPVLFVAGKYDNAVPLKDSLQQCHLPEISYFHVLENSGHMGMMEEAGKTNDILKKYFTEL